MSDPTDFPATEPLNLNPEAAATATRAYTDEGRAILDRGAQLPDFPVLSAGEGFGDWGQLLSRRLSAAGRHIERVGHAVVDRGSAATGQVESFSATDADGAAAFGGPGQ